MSQPLTSGSVVLGRHVFRLGTMHYYVTRHYRISPRPVGMDTSHAAILLDNQFSPILCSLASDAVEYIGTWVRRIIPAWDGSADEMYNGGPYPYYSSADPLPLQVCGLIRLTPVPNLGVHPGRIYSIAPPEDGNTDGVPNAAFMTALGAAATWFATTHTQIVPPLGTTAGATAWLKTTGPTINGLVVQATALDVWGTQRRRSATSKRTPAPFEPW